MTELAIIGAGGWGTALAIVLSPRFDRIRLWVYEKDLAARMRDTRENDIFLPGHSLPPNISITSDFAEAAPGADLILSVTPSSRVRGVYQEMLPHLSPSMSFVSATKGIENGTLLRMTDVILQVVGQSFPPRVAALSGPTFAREVAEGQPTALVVASRDLELASFCQFLFSGPTFRVYTNPDPIGVEIGGAVKNVVALGAGVCDGLGLGNNARAALITRGLSEISRLALALGGEARTLAGLAGLGDLVLTCTGALSRNRNVGLELAKGRQLADIVGSTRMVAEGVETTRATVELARRHGIQMPVAEQMNAMLHLGVSPREALRNLMERSLKGE